jgi:hypothetical protein
MSIEDVRRIALTGSLAYPVADSGRIREMEWFANEYEIPGALGRRAPARYCLASFGRSA